MNDEFSAKAGNSFFPFRHLWDGKTHWESCIILRCFSSFWSLFNKCWPEDLNTSAKTSPSVASPRLYEISLQLSLINDELMNYIIKNYILDLAQGPDPPFRNCDFILIITLIIMDQAIITKTLSYIFIHNHGPCLILVSFKMICHSCR